MTGEFSTQTLLESFRFSFIQLEALCKHYTSFEGMEEMREDELYVEQKISEKVMQIQILLDKTELDHFKTSSTMLPEIFNQLFETHNLSAEDLWKDDTLEDSFNLTGYRAYKAFNNYYQAMDKLFEEGTSLLNMQAVLKESQALKEVVPELDYNVALRSASSPSAEKLTKMQFDLFFLNKIQSVHPNSAFDSLDFQLAHWRNFSTAKELSKLTREYSLDLSSRKGSYEIDTIYVDLGQKLSVLYGVGANRAARRILEFADNNDPQKLRHVLETEPEIFSDSFRGWAGLNYSVRFEDYIDAVVDQAYQAVETFREEPTLIERLQDFSGSLERQSNFQISLNHSASGTKAIQTSHAQLGAGMLAHQLLKQPNSQSNSVENWFTVNLKTLLPSDILEDTDLYRPVLALKNVGLAAQLIEDDRDDALAKKAITQSLPDAVDCLIKHSDVLRKIAQKDINFYYVYEEAQKVIEKFAEAKSASKRPKLKLKP